MMDQQLAKIKDADTHLSYTNQTKDQIGQQPVASCSNNNQTLQHSTIETTCTSSTSEMNKEVMQEEQEKELVNIFKLTTQDWQKYVSQHKKLKILNHSLYCIRNSGQSWTKYGTKLSNQLRKQSKELEKLIETIDT